MHLLLPLSYIYFFLRFAFAEALNESDITPLPITNDSALGMDSQFSIKVAPSEVGLDETSLLLNAIRAIASLAHQPPIGRIKASQASTLERPWDDVEVVLIPSQTQSFQNRFAIWGIYQGARYLMRTRFIAIGLHLYWTDNLVGLVSFSPHPVAFNNVTILNSLGSVGCLDLEAHYLPGARPIPRRQFLTTVLKALLKIDEVGQNLRRVSDFSVHDDDQLVSLIVETRRPPARGQPVFTNAMAIDAIDYAAQWLARQGNYAEFAVLVKCGRTIIGFVRVMDRGAGGQVQSDGSIETL